MSANASHQRRRSKRNHPFHSNAGTAVIDLCDATTTTITTSVARRPTMPSIVVDLLHDDEIENDLIDITAAAPTATTITRGKTDPNERLSNSIHKKKRNRPTVENITDPKLVVLDVFPDADMAAVTQKLAEYDQSANTVITIFAEQGYPKSKDPNAISTQKKPPPLVHTSNNGTTTSTDTVDYMSASSFVPTPLYVQQATLKLSTDFPFLAKAAAGYLMRDSSNHYAIAHEKVIDALRGGSKSNKDETIQDQQYKNVMAALNGKPLQQTQIDRLKAISSQIPTLKHSRRKNNNVTASMVTEATLVKEVQHVQQKLHEWMGSIRIRQERQRMKEVSQREGTAVECLCCFDTYPLEDMVACRNEGHLFCCDCLKAYAENRVFGQNNLGMLKQNPKKPALELQCLYKDCCSGFDRPFLQKALPPKTLETYEKVQFEVSIQCAGVQTAKCPKCHFQADVPPEQKVFSCPVAECGYESCRECGEAAHIPLRCDEVEKQAETNGRITVEEAITAALIRRCPKCAKKFIKSDGCNKMTCSCGTKVCYLCRQIIIGYEHFCRTPHCNHQQCKMCPLFTNDAQDNARAMRDAGYAAAAQVRTNAQVDIDVEGLLRTK